MQGIGQIVQIIVQDLNPITVVYADSATVVNQGASSLGSQSTTLVDGAGNPVAGDTVYSNGQAVGTTDSSGSVTMTQDQWQGTLTAQNPTTSSSGGAGGVATNGGFLDFIIAITCLICMLMTHKFIRHFLDMLVPAGGRGGMFGSALMEGMGLAVGGKLAGGAMNMTKKAAKTVGGLSGAAGLAGLASAFKKPVDMSALKKPINVPGGGAGVDGGMAGLNPAGIGASDSPLGLGDGSVSYGDGFTMQGLGMGDSLGSEIPGANDGTGSMGASSGFSSAAASSSMFAGTSGNATSNKTGAVFDKGSKASGAFTKLSPGASGALGRFAQGAGNRLKSDIKHKLHNGDGRFRGNYAGGADNLLGVAMQEFEGVKQHNAQGAINHDTMFPSKEIKKAESNGDPFAAMQMQNIGQNQADMMQGYDWMKQGQQLMDVTEPQLEGVGTELEALDNDFDRGGSMITAMEMAGLSESTAYQEAQQNQAAIETQRQEVKHRFERLQAQMDSGQRMYQRGEKRVINAQNNIGKINYGFYGDRKRNSKYMIDAAAKAAGRKSLSDL